MRTVALLIALIAAGTAAAAPAPPELERINRLIALVETSRAVFIRNGGEYGSVAAAEHLRMKLRKAGDRVATADDFIRLVATASYLSGKPYLMRFPDGRVVPAGQWLRERLAAMDSAASATNTKPGGSRRAATP